MLYAVTSSTTSRAGSDWIDDDAAVGRRVVRKVGDEVTPDIWWRLVEALRACRRVTERGVQDCALRTGELHRAIRALAIVGARLPVPLPPVTGVEASELTDHVAIWLTVDSLVAMLSEELTEPGWTCRQRIAGFVEDLRIVLVHGALPLALRAVMR